MAFQAPFDIVGMRNQQMRENLAQQEQQQQYMGMISGALGDLANMYQKNEEMKAGVKAGEQFGKMFGKQFGLDPAIFNSPEYKGLPMQAQYQLTQGILSNFGSLAQSYNFGVNSGIRRDQQALTAAMPGIRNAANTAATVAGGGGTVPLQDNPADYTPIDAPGTGALQAAGAWYNQRSATPTSMSQGAMKPFYK